MFKVCHVICIYSLKKLLQHSSYDDVINQLFLLWYVCHVTSCKPKSHVNPIIILSLPHPDLCNLINHTEKNGPPIVLVVINIITGVHLRTR